MTDFPHRIRQRAWLGCALLALAACGALWSGTIIARQVPAAIFADGFESVPAQALSDEFDDPASVDRWQRIWFNEGWGRDPLQQIDVAQTRAGWLTLVPHTSSWYEDHVGELFYREIDGDFVLSTRIEARSRDGLGAPGSLHGGANDSEYSLVGLMLRAPRRDVESSGPAGWQPGFERYVFYSFGSANVAGSYQTEVKTTRAAIGGESHSVSVLQIDSVAVARIELRLARIGAHVIALRRVEGGSWQVHRRYLRDDLPPRLQAGVTCYTDWAVAGTYPYLEQNSTLITHAWNDAGTPADPDLRAQLDYLRFATPLVPPALQGADLSNPSAVSDAQLLAFLAFD
jgi:hypothetical protein